MTQGTHAQQLEAAARDAQERLEVSIQIMDLTQAWLKNTGLPESLAKARLAFDMGWFDGSTSNPKAMERALRKVDEFIAGHTDPRASVLQRLARIVTPDKRVSISLVDASV